MRICLAPARSYHTRLPSTSSHTCSGSGPAYAYPAGVVSMVPCSRPIQPMSTFTGHDGPSGTNGVMATGRNGDAAGAAAHA